MFAESFPKKCVRIGHVLTQPLPSTAGTGILKMYQLPSTECTGYLTCYHTIRLQHISRKMWEVNTQIYTRIKESPVHINSVFFT